jgi:tetratricopeptide (TPR) repeat protein
VKGYVMLLRAELTAAEGLYQRAHDLALETKDVRAMGRSLQGLGSIHRSRGDHESSTRVFQEAKSLFEQIGYTTGVSSCLHGLGTVALHHGELDAAAVLLEEALELRRDEGFLHGVAICQNDLAEIDRYRGDLDAAEAGYQRALEVFEAIGATDAVIARVNFLVVPLMRGDYLEPRRRLEVVAEELATTGRVELLCIVRSALLVCAAEARDWSALDSLLENVARQVSDAGLAVPDIAAFAQLAGDRAAAAGDPARARTVYERALEQWSQLSRKDKVDEVRGRLSNLE